MVQFIVHLYSQPLPFLIPNILALLFHSMPYSFSFSLLLKMIFISKSWNTSPTMRHFSRSCCLEVHFRMTYFQILLFYLLTFVITYNIISIVVLQPPKSFQQQYYFPVLISHRLKSAILLSSSSVISSTKLLVLRPYVNYI